jgi:hypothetical protein
VDQQARHTRKSRSNRKDGYRGHLASEPDTGLITDCEMTMATGEDNTDAAVGVKMVDRDRFPPAGRGGLSRGRPGRGGLSRGRPGRGGLSRGYRPCRHRGHCRDGGRCSRRLCGWRRAAGGLEVYGDSAYGSGEARAAYRAGGHDTVIKPKPLTPAVPGGFTLDDFNVDEANRAVTCPAGHTRPMSAGRTVTFGRLCADCPLRQRCTTAKDGRSMTIHEHEDLLRVARAQAKTRRPTRGSRWCR